jgi:protein-tyrosine phosphatase
MADWLPGVDADFKWVVPGIAVGGQPSRQQTRRLPLHGFDAILSVRAEDDPEDCQRVAERAGLKYQRVVVADSIAIPQEALDEIVKIAAGWRAQGLSILVHCQAGRRRGPIAVAAILVSEGWSAKAALHRVAAARKQFGPTPDQVASLKHFAHRHWHRHVMSRMHSGWAAAWMQFPQMRAHR